MPFVLLVAQQDAGRGFLAEVLSTNGFRVSEAVDPMDALTRARKDHFDLALVSLALRGYSGTELIRQLGAVQPRLPRVALAPDSSPQEHAEAIEAGAQAVLSRPFGSIDDLLRTLHSAMRGEAGSAST